MTEQRKIDIKRISFILLLATATLFPAWGQFDFDDGPGPVVITARIEPDTVRAGGTATLTVTFEFPDGYHQSLQEDFFFFRLEGPSGVLPGDIRYPGGIVKNGITEYYGSTELSADLRFDESLVQEGLDLNLTAGYQLCDEAGTCLFPVETAIDVPVTVLSPDPARGAGSILKFLLLALLGGLLLNVMPCVLPVLSVKALSLVKQGGSDRGKILAGSLAYTAGILVSMAALALVVIILKLSGEMVGWGFQFQNPVFVLILISIVFVFALSLFDVFVITAPGMTTISRASGKKGLFGSFATGAFAVLLATPCSAPFLGTALGFAFSQPPGVIMAIFLFIGTGLSLPFLLLGIYPGFISRIPKPGNWMNTFKEIMGFLLIATTLWLLSVLYHQVGGRALISVLIYLAVLAFAGWVYGRFGKPSSPRPRRIRAMTAALVIIVAGAVLVPDIDGSEPGGTDTDEAYMPQEWEDFSPARLEAYLLEGRPVFLAFGAKWCLTCATNERTVLYTGEVIGNFTDAGVTLLHGDYTNKDEVIGSILAQYGKGGVPFYAFYPPMQPEPVILPELLSRQMIRDLLDKHL